MTHTTNKETECSVAQLESVMEDIEENGEDVASLEKQLAELSRQGEWQSSKPNSRPSKNGLEL